MELPLFPLNTVLCPGIALPLHVFEDRYRAMVRHCLESASPFGVVLIREGREVGTGAISFTGIGTIAEIRDAGSYDDGRYDLLVVGTRRFEIRRVLSGRRPYLVAEVDVLTETVGDEETAHRLAMTATRRFVKYLELLQPRSGETADEIDVRVEVDTADDDEDEGAAGPPEAEGDAGADGEANATRRVAIPDDPTVLSYLLSGIVQVESIRRQGLLESPTTELRLAELAHLLEREIALLERGLSRYAPDPRLSFLRRN